MTAVKQRLQVRHDPAATWTSANPTLRSGEVGFEEDTGKFKIGDGATAWVSLAYSAAQPADLAAYLKRDGSVALTGALNADSHKITNVTDPDSAQDAATKHYVDASVAATGVPDEIARAEAAEATKVAKDTLVYNVLDHGATGDGTSDDTAAINTLIATVGAAGGGTVWVPPTANGYYLGTSGSPGETLPGCIMIRYPNVRLVGNNTKLTLGCAAGFIGVKSVLDVATTNVRPGLLTKAIITADTAKTDTTLVVDDSSSFTVGQWVLVKLGDAAYDVNEPDYWYFAKVTAVADGTHVTLDRPTDYALTVASVVHSDGHKTVIPITRLVENVVVEGFEMTNPMTGSANAQYGASGFFCRDIEFDRLVGTDVGPGVVGFSYADACTFGTVQTRVCTQQGGQLSLGRGVSISHARNIRGRMAYLRGCQGIAVYVEAASDGVRIDSVRIDNTYPGRSDSTVPLIYHSGNSRARYGELVVTGRAGRLYDVATTADTIGIDLYVDGSTGTTVVNDISVCREMRVHDLNYGEIRRQSRQIALRPNMAGVVTSLPSGLCRRLKIYASSTTGITAVYPHNGTQADTSVVSLLAADTTVTIAPAGGPMSIGNSSPHTFNAVETKALAISTDGTVPAGAYLTVDMDYFVAQGVSDDGSHGRLDEPAAAFGLLAANNLSDVASAATARTNLAVQPYGRVTFIDADVTIAATAVYAAQTGTMTAARTATLPAANAVPAGWEIIVGDQNGSVTTTNTITVVPAGSDTINGSGAGVVLSSSNEQARFISNGVSLWSYDRNAVHVAATQTLTRKTLTSPVLNAGVSGTAVDTDSTFAANSDTILASQKAVKTALALKAAVASPTFTGTVTIPSGASITAPTGLVKGDVGLGNVDNTADANKPVSTAQAAADALKANIASPTFTGTTTAPFFVASGLTGATAASRYVGATTGGPPASGTFVAGDFVLDPSGVIICVTGGTPGTWRRAGAGTLCYDTGATVSNNAAATTLLSAAQSIPASLLRVGDSLDMVVAGTFTNNTGSSQTLGGFTVTVGGQNVLVAVPVAFATNASAHPFEIRVGLTVTAVGVSATGVASGAFTISNATGSNYGSLQTANCMVGRMAWSGANSTTAMAIDAKVTLNTADANLSCAATRFEVAHKPMRV